MTVKETNEASTKDTYMTQENQEGEKKAKWGKYKNVYSSPFCFLQPSLFAQTLLQLILLLPQMFLLYLTKSYSCLSLIFACCLAAVLSLIFDFVFFHKTTYLLPQILQGAFCGMFLPEDFPVATAFFVVLVVFLVYDYGFKGFSKSFVVPCVVAVVMSYCCIPSCFGTMPLTKDALLQSPAFAIFLKETDFAPLPFDTSITDFLNKNLFSFLGFDVPYGYVSLLWDSQSIIPAFRFNFLTLLSSAILFCLDCSKPLIPGVFLFVYLTLVKTAGPLFFGGRFLGGDMILALFSGGTLFTALYLIAWYATTPIYLHSKIVYAVVAGVVAFFVAGCGASHIGFIFTVLIMNIISCIIQVIETNIANAKLKAKTASIDFRSSVSAWRR